MSPGCEDHPKPLEGPESTSPLDDSGHGESPVLPVSNEARQGGDQGSGNDFPDDSGLRLEKSEDIQFEPSREEGPWVPPQVSDCSLLENWLSNLDKAEPV